MKTDGPLQPLQGVKVLDLTHVWSGPYCTMMLGELGAEVIKVEPLGGDQFRTTLDSCIFPNINRNKRAIALDLKKREGKEIVLKLAGKSDIFMENSLPGAMDRLGLGYEAIHHLNPRIIYCSISGFGQSGPFRERPAYDPILQAMSGIMIITGESDRPPSRIIPGFIDHTTGLFAAFGIMASLMEREKTGKGQRIDIALLDAALTAICHLSTYYKKTGQLPQRYGSATLLGAPIQAFETQDGYIYITANTDPMWKNLCKVLELDDLADNPRFSTAALRSQNREGYLDILSKAVKKYGSEELESKLLGVNVPCCKLRTIEEILQEPHVQSRQIIEETDYPPLGKITITKTPIFYSGQNPPAGSRAPLLNEHMKDILGELGYSAAEIQDLIKKGVTRQQEPSAGGDSGPQYL